MPERIEDKIFGMSAWGRETMRCLFLNGPTWDGDLPSKAGRGDLVKLGYADRGHGWNWLTSKGVEFAVKSLMLDVQKDRQDRLRRKASDQRAERGKLLREFISWAGKATDGPHGIDYLNGDSKKYPTPKGKNAWDDLDKIVMAANAHLEGREP